MQGKRCKICGGQVQKFDSKVCSHCEADLQENFLEVKNFLQDNPGSGAAFIADETGIDEKFIVYMIDEKWLERDTSGARKKCSGCGKPIASGQFCPQCAVGVTSSLERARKALMDEQKKQMTVYTRDTTKK